MVKATVSADNSKLYDDVIGGILDIEGMDVPRDAKSAKRRDKDARNGCRKWPETTC